MSRSLALINASFCISLGIGSLSPVQAQQNEGAWTLASQCFEWDRFEKVITSITPLKEGDACTEQITADLKRVFNQALNDARMADRSMPYGVCQRQNRIFRPAPGHYVVWRNYRTDLWFRYAKENESGSDQLVKQRTAVRDMLKSHLSNETLRCAFPMGHYNSRLFDYSADGKESLQVGLSLGNDDGEGTGVDEAALKEYQEQLEGLQEASETEFSHSPSTDRIGDTRSEAAEKTAEAKKAAEEGEDGGSALTESSSDGVLPPAAPPWISNLAQMILASYGLDQYAEFGALAMMALAPELLNELAAFSAELTAGLNSDELNDVMGALAEAYKIGSMLASLSAGYDAIAEAGSLESAILEATIQIRDMHPALREELAEELGPDFEKLQKYSDILVAEDLAAIGDVISDPDKIEGILDRVGDHVVTKVEETAVSEAIKHIPGVPTDLALGLYRGAVDQNAVQLGAAFLNEVAPELKLSEADVSAISRGDLKSVARSQAENRLTEVFQDALDEIGISPGAIAVATSLASADDPATALQQATLAALPPDISGPANALLNGDSGKALTELAVKTLGSDPAADAVRQLLEGADPAEVAQLAVQAEIRAAIGDEIPLPDDFTPESLSRTAAYAMVRKGGETGEMGLAVLAAINGNPADIERLGRQAVAKAIPDNLALDAAVMRATLALLSDPVTDETRRTMQPLTSALEEFGASEHNRATVTSLVSLAAAPQFAEPLKALPDIFDAPSWRHDFAFALAQGDATALRLAAVAYGAETETLSEVSKDLAQLALTSAIESNSTVGALLGKDAASFAKALLDRNTEAMLETAGRRADRLKAEVGEVMATDVQALAQTASVELVTDLAEQLLDPRAAEILSAESPTATLIALSTKELENLEGGVLSAYFNGGPDAAVAAASGSLSEAIGHYSHALLVERRDPAEVGAELIRDAFQRRYGRQARAHVPDLLDTDSAPLQALTTMVPARRLALGERLDGDQATTRAILNAWPDTSARSQAVFAWSAEDVARRGIDIERAILRQLAELWDGAVPLPDNARTARSFETAGTALADVPAGAVSAPLRDAIVRQNVGEALLLATEQADFLSILVEDVASVALQNAAARSPLAAPLAELGGDPHALLISEDARAKAVDALQSRAEHEVARLETEAVEALAELHALAIAANPLAFALGEVPTPLRPIVEALLAQEPVTPALRESAKVALGPALGEGLVNLIFDEDLLSRLNTLEDSDAAAVSAAVAVAERIRPGTFVTANPNLEEISALADTQPERIIALIEGAEMAKASEKTVVLALVATALSDTPLNRAYLNSALEVHIGEALALSGLAPEVLAAKSLRTALAQAAANGPPELARLAAIVSPEELESTIQSLETPVFETVIIAVSDQGQTVDSLLLARSGQLSAAWSQGVPHNDGQAALRLSGLLVANAIERDRTARLIFGEDAARQLRMTLERDASLEDAISEVFQASIQNISERAGVARGRTAWPGLRRRMKEANVSSRVSEALQGAVLEGIPVLPHLKEEADAALSRQGLSKTVRTAIIKEGRSEALGTLAFGELMHKAGSKRVSVDPSAEAISTLLKLIDPLFRAQLTLSPVQREALRVGASEQCLAEASCISNMAAFLQPPLTAEEAEGWLRLRGLEREALAERVLARLSCPGEDASCNWRTVAVAHEARIRRTTISKLPSQQDARDILDGAPRPVAERTSKRLQDETAKALTKATAKFPTQASTVDGALTAVRDAGVGAAPNLDEAQLQATWDARRARLESYSDRSEAIKSCVSLGLGTEAACMACTADPDYLAARGEPETTTCAAN